MSPSKQPLLDRFSLIPHYRMMANDDDTGENFFQRIISAIFGSADPEVEKRRLLKAIAKDLSRSKYKFYKFSSEETLIPLAKFFFELYKIIGPAQLLFQNIQNPNTFKYAVIDFMMSEKQCQIIEMLTEESILERAKTIPAKELASKINEDLTLLSNEFDLEKIRRIDALYSKLMLFSAFCTFDYYFLLKKFDSNLHERDFNYIPRFEAIRGEYIADDLKDFIAVAWALPLSEDWSDVVSLLRDLKGIEPIAAGVWTKTINKLKDLQSSQIFEKTIQLITHDPSYTPVFTSKQERIFEPYFEKLKTQAELTIKKVEQEKTNSKAENLLQNIFGTTVVLRLKNYTESANIAFDKKRIPGYKHHLALNFMKAFLVDYLKKNIREFTDLILVRGKWVTAALSGQMSESYQTLLSISDQITEFDTMLSDESEQGLKIKNILIKADRDKEAARILRSILKDTNDKAIFLVTSGAQNLVIFARTVKSLLEDREKPQPQMLINWKELDRFVDKPIRETGIEIYKMIHQFIMLIQLYLPKD